MWAGLVLLAFGLFLTILGWAQGNYNIIGFGNITCVLSGVVFRLASLKRKVDELDRRM